MPLSGLESFFLDKLIEYLRLMEKDFEAGSGGITVHEELNGKKFDINIYPSERWIRIQVELDNISDIPEDRREEFLRKLLRATWNYPEISFGIDENGNILAIQDEYVFAFYYDTFEEEYAAILASVDTYQKLREEMLGQKIETKTKKKNSEKEKAEA